MKEVNKNIYGQELEKPIGDFIIENGKGVHGHDGIYYHYSEVCKLLKLKEKEIRENLKKIR